MIIAAIKDFLINFIHQIGYLGIFIAMLIESCLIPLPSEVTMPLAGALASSGAMNINIAALVGAFGNLTGSLIAYFIGYKVKESTIIKFIKRWGKFFLVSTEEYEKAKCWLGKYGNQVSFFSRLLPAVRTVVSLPAGVARIKLVPFMIYTFAGSLLWSYVLVVLGYKLGQNWEAIEPYFRKFELVVIVLFVALVAFFVYKKLKKGKAKAKVAC